MLSRARTRWCPLVALLLVVLGALCGPAAAAERSTPPAAPAAPAAAAAPFVQGADGHGVPGCGQGGDQDLGQRPAVPPRPGPSYELPLAPYDVRAQAGVWGADQAVHAAACALRAPPPLVPPSPVDLSVLRV
ncbi:hypothetical protein [Streptomyces sp. NPDC059063]|uniref:hypothetical protein n=1 Tax=unclassified Streptomyces TaxID=2593676 RepID=UPI00368E881E